MKVSTLPTGEYLPPPSRPLTERLLGACADAFWRSLVFAGTLTISVAAIVLFQGRVWTSRATLAPVSGGSSGAMGLLATLASQAGLSGLSGSAPAELASVAAIAMSRRVQASLLKTPVANPTNAGERIPLISLIAPDSTGDAEARFDRALAELRERWVTVSIDPKAPLLYLSVSAPNADLAHELTTHLLSLVSTNLVSVHRPVISEAVRFLEEQSEAAYDSLTAAERALVAFHAANRTIGSSPALQLEEQRLQRRTQLHLDLYLSLRQQLATAQLTEAREIANVAVVDEPFRPGRADRRYLVLKSISGFVAGVILALLWVTLREIARHVSQRRPDLIARAAATLPGSSRKRRLP